MSLYTIYHLLLLYFHQLLSKLLCSLRLLRSQLHQQINQRIRTNRKNNHNPRIPPPVVILLQIHRVQIIAAPAVLAHATPSVRIGIHQVHARAHTLHEGGEVLAARGAVGRVEEGEFLFLAGDFRIVDAEDQHATHEVVEGVEVVDPVAPEGLDLRVGDEDATKRNESTDDEGIGEGCEDGIRRVGRDELPDTRVYEFVHEHDEEHAACFVGVARESDGVIPADEVEDGTDAEVGEFRDDQGRHEGHPRVHLGFFLTGVVDISPLEEERLQLVYHTGGDEDEVEYSEQAKLHV